MFVKLKKKKEKKAILVFVRMARILKLWCQTIYLGMKLTLLKDGVAIVGLFFLEQIEYLWVRMVCGLYHEQGRYVFGGYVVVRKQE